MEDSSPSKEAFKHYTFRLPIALLSKIKAEADKNERSTNGEVVYQLRQLFGVHA